MAGLFIRGERVVLPGGIRAATLAIVDGRIAGVLPYASTPSSGKPIDAGALVVMPGIVDTHVHVNEPGRTEWEGFRSATRAAAAGGITTLVDMPLNSVPATTTLAGLQAKLRAAEGQCHVDVGFWGGVVPGNAAGVAGLGRAGVLGFKCFLSPSGVEEFEHAAEADLREVMPLLAAAGLPLLVHAELPGQLRPMEPGADPASHASWLATRPPEAEEAAVGMLVSLAREFRVHVHVVHVAAAGAVALLAEARASGVPVTAESCPHYLSFCAEEIPDRRVEFKCAPPIRDRHHRDALWQGLRDGVLDLVATDHSPAPPEVKRLEEGDFFASWGGISSLQLSLPAVWTEAKARGFSIEDVSRWLCAAPARLAGLDPAKGRIAEGADADLVLWDPDAEFVVTGDVLEHRHKATPYAGRRLRGRVYRTMLRGMTIYEDGRFSGPSAGRPLLRRTANIPEP
jgi:allantoinase